MQQNIINNLENAFPNRKMEFKKVSGLGLVAKLEHENENDLFGDTILITSKNEIKKRFKSVSFNGKNRIIWIEQSEIETIKQNVDFDDYVVSFALLNNYSINFNKHNTNIAAIKINK